MGRICADQPSTEKNHFSFYAIPFIQPKSLTQPKLSTFIGFELFQVNALNNTETKIFDCMHFVCFEKQ